MAKDYDSISETGNWNVASEYARLKIMKPLYLADEYETIATFGTSDFFEEIQINYDTDFLKIKAFKRLVNILVMLIDNTKFAIKTPGDQTTLENLRKNLKRIEKLSPILYKVNKNNIKKIKTIKIEEEIFSSLLEEVLSMKSQINECLNKSDLLFTNKTEFDPKEHKDALFKSVTQEG